MPVYCITSTKGGVGKSTTAAAIATTLAALEKRKVKVIDLDPNTTLGNWAKKRPYPGVSVTPCKTEDFPALWAATAAEKWDDIVIDLPGFGHIDILKAFARADVVIIPACKSEPDLLEALKTTKLVAQVAETIGKAIPCGVLLTRVGNFNNRLSTHLDGEAAGRWRLPVFETQIVERVAYKRMFVEAKGVHEIDEKAELEVAHVLAECRALMDGQHNLVRGAA